MSSLLVAASVSPPPPGWLGRTSSNLTKPHPPAHTRRRARPKSTPSGERTPSLADARLANASTPRTRRTAPVETRRSVPFEIVPRARSHRSVRRRRAMVTASCARRERDDARAVECALRGRCARVGRAQRRTIVTSAASDAARRRAGRRLPGERRVRRRERGESRGGF